MNAGAFGGELSQLITFLDCLDQKGRRLTITRHQADFGYRHSRMMEEGLVVLGAELELQPGNKEDLYQQMREYQEARRAKQPLTWPSAGSFFKRPAGLFAGALIEQAGLKGTTIGGAQVRKARRLYDQHRGRHHPGLFAAEKPGAAPGAGAVWRDAGAGSAHHRGCDGGMSFTRDVKTELVAIPITRMLRQGGTGGPHPGGILFKPIRRQGIKP